MSFVKKILSLGVLSIFFSGCAVNECLDRKNKDEPVLVRITKGPDGVPQVTPKTVVVYPNQEVIFMSKWDFKLDFIGLSPIDLRMRGQKRFESKDGDVIFRSTGRVDESESASFDGYLNGIKKDESINRLSNSIDEIKGKAPKFTKDYVEIQYTIEIDGVVLDPPYRRIKEN